MRLCSHLLNSGNLARPVGASLRDGVRHAPSAADEDELADQRSVLGSDLLGDEAAERKAQQIDLGEAKQADEVDRVSRHRRDIVGRLTSRWTSRARPPPRGRMKPTKFRSGQLSR